MFNEVKITKEMLDMAIQRDVEAGPAFKGASIEGGKGRFYGFLGEEIVLATIPGTVLENTKNYDLKIGNVTFDVKTKTRKDPPKAWYDASVDKSSSHQTPDFYIFVQILAPQNLIRLSAEEIRNFQYQKAWILGFISRKDFYAAPPTFFTAGSTDPSNGITYRDSIYLLKCGKLSDSNKLVNTAKTIELLRQT